GVNVFSQATGGGAGDIHQSDLSQIFAGVTTINPDNNPAHSFNAGVLADNGGPVQTVLILTNGAAHNTGTTSALPLRTYDIDGDGNTSERLPLDAIGESRVFGASVDIGAFELQEAPNTPPVLTAPSSPTYTETAGDDSFFISFGTLSASDADTGDTLTYG